MVNEGFHEGFPGFEIMAIFPERMIQGKSRVGVKLTLGPESPMNYFIEDFQGLKNNDHFRIGDF